MNKPPRRTARTPRFYLDTEVKAGQDLSLSKQASHHLINVLRMRKDARIELFNGDGNNYRAILVNTGQQGNGKCAVLNVQQHHPNPTESNLQIELVQAVLSSDKMDSTIRQSVELGVSALQPIYTQQSARVNDEKRLARKVEHWRNIIISACEQSGRSCLPDLAEPLELSEWLSRLSTQEQPDDKGTSRYMLTPEAKQTLTQHALSQAHQRVSVLIGPESGFDPHEAALAIQHGIDTVSFGPRILRTETAGPACIASLQCILGDLGSAVI